MAGSIANVAEIVTPGDLGEEVGAFVRGLRRENVSVNTIATYSTALRQLAEFLEAHNYPTDVRAIEERHVDEWIIDLLERMKPATAHNRFRGSQRFFNWLAERDETFVSPMRRMHPPKLPEYMPRVLTLDELRTVLAACRGKTFEDLRDTALVRVFFNSGARRAEIANLRYSRTDPAIRDVNLARGTIHVVGKGDRDRTVGIDSNTTAALDDYLRARRTHPASGEPWLWLGKRGRLTDSGIAQAIRDRGMQAGIPALHPHDLRHAWRHHLETAGAGRETLMALGGWQSDSMLRRYASTTANDRALEASRKLALGDKL